MVFWSKRTKKIYDFKRKFKVSSAFLFSAGLKRGKTLTFLSQKEKKVLRTAIRDASSGISHKQFVLSYRSFEKKESHNIWKKTKSRVVLQSSKYVPEKRASNCVLHSKTQKKSFMCTGWNKIFIKEKITTSDCVQINRFFCEFLAGFHRNVDSSGEMNRPNRPTAKFFNYVTRKITSGKSVLTHLDKYTVNKTCLGSQ